MIESNPMNENAQRPRSTSNVLTTDAEGTITHRNEANLGDLFNEFSDVLNKLPKTSQCMKNITISTIR